MSSGTVRAALVPGVPALLPPYAGGVDPVAALRAACRGAVVDLVAAAPTRVVVATCPVRPDNLLRGVRTPPGLRVACHLLDEAGYDGVVTSDSDGVPGPGEALLLVGNGSACRSEKAPGHLDARAFELDEALDRTVREGAAPPRDPVLAEEVWCYDLPVFERLHAAVAGRADVRYADDPYGVAYWVATWPGLREGDR